MITMININNDLCSVAYAARDVMRRAAHLLDRTGGPNKKAMAQQLRENADRLDAACNSYACREIEEIIRAYSNQSRSKS